MMLSGKLLLILGTILSGSGVALGAVGAHALKATLEFNGRVDTFETGIKYHLYHGLALLIIGIISTVKQELDLTWPGSLILIGVLFFSVSLYVLSLTSIHWVVYVTPVGGMLMIAGWIVLLIKLIQ